MNGDSIQEFVGKKVQIFTVHGGGEVQVVGTLESFDGIWLKLRKSDSDVFYFSVYQTRAVKNFL